MNEKERCTYSEQYKGFLLSFTRKPILNLGCDAFRMDGVNVDYNKAVNPDILWDLNGFPYPFKDGSFGSVFLIDVLEHLKYPPLTISECHRMLKDGGLVIIAVPSERSKYYRDAEEGKHLFQFKREDFKELEDEGFKCRIIGYRGNSTIIPSWLGRLMGLFVPNEYVIILEKRGATI